MKIGPFGALEIAIILIVILIIFGPKNLPKLGSAIGKAVKNLREGLGSTKKAPESKANAASETADDIEVEVIDKPEAASEPEPEPKPKPKAKPAPSSMQSEEESKEA